MIPSELDGDCTFFQETCLAVHLGVNVLTAGSTALAEQDVDGTLILNTGNDVDTQAVHLLCIGVAWTHEDFLAHLLGYVLQGSSANKIFRKCCHNFQLIIKK